MSNLLIHRVFLIRLILSLINSIDGSDPEIIKGAQPFPAFKTVIEKKLLQED